MERKNRGFLKNLFIISGLCTLFLAGCGYTTRSLIADKYQSVYITPFVNKIDFISETEVANKYRVYRPMLESEITKAIIDKFIADGNLQVVKKESADLILTGDLVEFRKDPLRYTDNDDVAEYRLNMVINMKLLDTIHNKIVWEENGFTGDFSYFTTGPLAQSEDDAVNSAVRDLARRIVERTVEQW